MASPIAVFLLLLAFSYITYQLFLHPLAHIPGPRLAALTNPWKVYHIYSTQLHEVLLELHKVYGPVIRIGPNDVHIQNREAVDTIYKGGRAFPKTSFYNSWQTFNHNLFGTQDDDLHALRRRQLAHGFGQKSIVEMEDILDGRLTVLCDRITMFAETGQTFDFKDCISRYVLDILGEAAFSCSFNAQIPGAGEFEQVPKAINGHVLMGSIIGELPFQSFNKRLLAWSPFEWMRDIVNNRMLLQDTCAGCVQARVDGGSNKDRKDLLLSLIKAKDPETGASLTTIDINTEAFAMLVAGSHTTAGTLGLLFAHSLRDPQIMARLVSELDSKLDPLGQSTGRRTHAITGLEDSLPYLMACVRENFRMTPVFTMPLWRRVTASEGLAVGNTVIPPNTNVSASNFVQHHDASVWGVDHAKFDPDRWLDGRTEGLSAALIPFSLGHRMCIGRNLAMTNILKTISTLLTRFEITMMEDARKEPVRFGSYGIGELQGTLTCTARSRNI
ncbi:cytochrome p450 monooxygenase like protein [Zymoseptoria brevis]|uniref:Cytochrome p450 monooxygenase like protein n=1 Tax=Zymoseptoria brevis TaxID=1047168 RepID=A0A0F4GJ12_9PEZI|nr:cytochrome p450 monooxygenase like protein [Zymoseptoria brevis]